MRGQITITVNEAKRLIAKAIVQLPKVQDALREGKVLLKGGTTVSAVAEELVGFSLRISGRVTPLGTKAAWIKTGAPHTVLIEKGEPKNVDGCLEEVAGAMNRDDVAIVGANALDIYGNAALMAGAPLGGGTERVLEGLMTKGAIIIVAAGLEKLIPHPIQEAVRAAGRETIDVAIGMEVGLMPIVGRVITEVEAIESLAEVKATVIGAGGIMGAEGATTLVVEGEREEVQKIFAWVQEIKGAPLSGDPDSMAECGPGNPACPRHPACIYRMPPSR